MKLKLSLLIIVILINAYSYSASKSMALSAAGVPMALQTADFKRLSEEQSYQVFDFGNRALLKASVADVDLKGELESEPKSRLRMQQDVLSEALPKSMPSVLTSIISENLKIPHDPIANLLNRYSYDGGNQLSDGKILYRFGASIEIFDLIDNEYLCVNAITIATVTQNDRDTFISAIQLPDGRLVSITHFGLVNIWDLNDENKYVCVDTIKLTKSGIIAPNLNNVDMCQLKNGMLAFLKREHEMEIWDLNEYGKYECICSLIEVYSFLQLNDGNLAFYGGGNKVEIWALKQGRYKCIDVLENTQYVDSLMQLHDGNLACFSNDRRISKDQTINIWMLNKDKKKYECINTSIIKDSAVTFNFNIAHETQLKDGSLAFCYGSKIIILKMNKRIGEYQGHYECVDVLEHEYSVGMFIQLNDGRLISLCREPFIFGTCSIKVWNLNNKTQKYVMIEEIIQDGPAIRLRDGTLIHLGRAGNFLKLWPENLDLTGEKPVKPIVKNNWFPKFSLASIAVVALYKCVTALRK